MIRKLRSLFTREGLLVLVVAGLMLLVGWLKGINLLILLGFISAAITLLNWNLSRRQINRVQAQRRWSGPVFAGAQARWTVEINNPSDRATFGIELLDAASDHEAGWFVDRLRVRQVVRVPASAVFPRRGIIPLEPLTARCLFPFGLAWRQRSIGEPGECVVLPRLGALNMVRFRQWLNRLTRDRGQRHRVARPSIIHQDDLHGLRAFRPGDNPRWIHWRTSARRNVKMVREFEEEAGLSLGVVLDPASEMIGCFDPALETAVSLAASICWEWCAHHEDYLVAGALGAKPVVHRGRPSRDLANEVLRTFATVEGQALAAMQQAPQRLFDRPIGGPLLLVGAKQNEALRSALQAQCRQQVVNVTIDAARDFYEEPEVENGANSPQPRNGNIVR